MMNNVSNFFIPKNVKEVHDTIGPDRPIRNTRNITKAFLLAHPTIMHQGIVYDTCAKSIGAGVYEISLRKREFK